jgi:hypothetical protein
VVSEDASNWKNMPSSQENALARLEQWAVSKAPIKALFAGKGLAMNVVGHIVLDAKKSRIWLIKGDEQKPELMLSLSLQEALRLVRFAIKG